MKVPWRPVWITSLLLVAALAAHGLAPVPVVAPGTSRLADLIPEGFGDWRQIDGELRQVDPSVPGEGAMGQTGPYDDVLMRSYENRLGEVVHLALAYGRKQSQENKIHRPSLCYLSQGFRQQGSGHASLGNLGISQMTMIGSGRVDEVSYWIRTGHLVTDNPWRIRGYLLREGIAGRVQDGILVRVSTIRFGGDPGTGREFELHKAFLADLLKATDSRGRRLLLGGPPA